ncbi:MAG: nucleotide exchange factor GrpE [Leptolyngbyaceae cyanobacterium RU_5_1]|nr:nucleotide exchange factor GrpE [Leptolyngbyaceae cyanobacterium RU_5_1]
MIDEENQLDEMQPSTVDSTATGVSSEQEDQEGVNPAEMHESLMEPGSSDFADDAVNSAVSDPAVGEVLNGVDYQAKPLEMQGEIQALTVQLEDRTNQYMRIAADFDNYRRRTQREKEEFEQQVKCSTISELLPVVDNFERARSHIKPQTEQETAIHKSYQSVYKQLVDCLKRIGVSPMRSEGKEFDPNLHEAVMRQPTDEYAEGTVIEELQRGYMLGDRVLRHALVKVAAQPEPMITSEEIDQGNSEG